MKLKLTREERERLEFINQRVREELRKAMMNHNHRFAQPLKELRDTALKYPYWLKQPSLDELAWLFAHSCGWTDQGSVYCQFAPCIMFTGDDDEQLVHFGRQTYHYFNLQPGMWIKVFLDADCRNLMVQNLTRAEIELETGEKLTEPFITEPGRYKNGAFTLQSGSWADVSKLLRGFETKAVKIKLAINRGQSNCHVHVSGSGSASWRLGVDRPLVLKHKNGIALLEEVPSLRRLCVPLYQHGLGKNFLLGPLCQAVPLGFRRRRTDPYRFLKCIGKVLPEARVDTPQDLRLPPLPGSMPAAVTEYVYGSTNKKRVS